MLIYCPMKCPFSRSELSNDYMHAITSVFTEETDLPAHAFSLACSALNTDLSHGPMQTDASMPQTSTLNQSTALPFSSSDSSTIGSSLWTELDCSNRTVQRGQKSAGVMDGHVHIWPAYFALILPTCWLKTPLHHVSVSYMYSALDLKPSLC